MICQNCSHLRTVLPMICKWKGVLICPTFQKSKKAFTRAEPQSSVGRVAHLRTGGGWFDPRLGQNSFRGLVIVIATGFIPLSPLSDVSTMVMWESRRWLGKNIMQNSCSKNTRKAWIGALATVI